MQTMDKYVMHTGMAKQTYLLNAQLEPWLTWEKAYLACPQAVHYTSLNLTGKCGIYVRETWGRFIDQWHRALALCVDDSKLNPSISN